MTNIFWNIFELAVNIFEAANVMYFVFAFLKGNIHNKKECRNWMVGSLTYATTSTFLNSFMDYEGYFLLIYFVIVFVYSLIFFHGSILKKLFTSAFSVSCLILVSTIITGIVTNAAKAPLTQVYSESGWIRLLTVILVQITDFYLFQILIRIFRNKDVRLRKTEWILLLSIFLLSTAIIVLIQLAQLKNDLTPNTRIILLFADVCIVIINIITIKIITLLNQQYHTKMENELLNTKLQYQTQYTTAVQQQEESVKKQRHDIKNSMTVLYKLADQEDINRIKKYIQQYIEHYHNEISFVHTNHTIVDAIINTKLSYANEIGINTVCLIDSNLPDISDTDYCSLLGNMLDNAIEDSDTNKIVAPAPLFDHGNSLFNFAGRDALESEESFQEYVDTLLPCVYDDYIAEAKAVLTNRHKAGLRHLLTFEFKAHSTYNLPAKRLKLIQNQVRKRAALLLDA